MITTQPVQHPVLLAEQLSPLPPSLESELRLFFADALAPGLESNFAQMVVALQRHMGGDHYEQDAARSTWTVRVKAASSRAQGCTELNDWLLKRADNERPLRRALAALEPRHAEVLRVLLSGDVHGASLFGAAGALAPLTRAARDAWSRSSTTHPLELWLYKLGHRARTGRSATQGLDRLLVREVTAECHRLYCQAADAFLRALSRYRSQRQARRAAVERARDARLSGGATA